VRTVLKDLECPDSEISILFVDDAQIEGMNKEHLGRSGPTNVISFSMVEGDFGDINPHILGDVVISVETAKRQSMESQSSFEEMIDFLLIHGILHLMGYDHEGPDAETHLMETKEEELLYKTVNMTE